MPYFLTTENNFNMFHKAQDILDIQHVIVDQTSASIIWLNYRREWNDYIIAKNQFLIGYLNIENLYSIILLF